MKTLTIALYVLGCFALCHATAPEVIISKRPEWQKAILENVEFSAETKGIDEILGRKISRSNESWKGFVIFSCTAKKNLGKRLLWIDVEVEFSNGDKRKFEGIKFHILNKGIEYDIAKILSADEKSISAKSITVNSIIMK